MNKTEFGKLLIKRGYRVLSDDDGVPTVLSGAEVYKGTIREVKALVKECGYDQSFAIKKADSAKLKALSEEDTDTDNDNYDTDETEDGQNTEKTTMGIPEQETGMIQNTIKTEDDLKKDAVSEKTDNLSINETADEEVQITAEPETPDAFDIFSTDNWLFDEDSF